MRSMRRICCALLLSVAAAQEPHPDSGWQTYVGYDASEAYDWSEAEHRLGGAGYSLETTSDFPRGPPPLECYDKCYDDSQCHGFVLWQKRCYFRGGPTQGPLHLLREKSPRPDMSLFVLYGEHPVAPVVGTTGAATVFTLIGLGLVAILGAAGLIALFRKRNPCAKEKPVMPVLVPQKGGDIDKRSGCDVGCMGSRKKKTRIHGVILV